VVVAVLEVARGVSTRAAAEQARTWDGLIVVCAANHYEGIKLADQHMAEHLSALAPVLYVDPPISRLTSLRNPEAARLIQRPRLRIQAPGLARLTPLVQPCPSRPGMTGVTAAVLRHHLRRAVTRLGGRVRAVVSAWPQYPVFGSCREEARVYWAQDDFVGGAALLGLNAPHLEARERGVAAAAGLVVAANPLVADTWRARDREVALIPYGADVNAYADVDRAPLPADADLPGPVVGFVGQINDRTDLRLLEAVADRNRSLLLVGPADPAFEPGRFAALLRRPNVRWVGGKPFAALPGYLRSIDVGLVPYRDSPFNRGSFPLKTLEYLAAGRAVVATDLPAIRWLATDLVAVASEPQPFADHVDRLLGEVRSPALIARRRAFAGQHSWSGRAAGLYEAVLGQRGQARPARDDQEACSLELLSRSHRAGGATFSVSRASAARAAYVEASTARNGPAEASRARSRAVDGVVAGGVAGGSGRRRFSELPW
jgi:teichuronic acid biosynthesis glycosyltransferase TuaH